MSQNPFSSLVHRSQIAHHSANRRAFGASSTASVSIVSTPPMCLCQPHPHGHRNPKLDERRTEAEADGRLVLLARIVLDPAEVRVAFEDDPAIRPRGLALEPEPDLAVPQQARRERHDQLRAVPCSRLSVSFMRIV